MTPTITIRIHGNPAPQGSKNAWVNPHTGRAVLTDKNPKTLKTWRDDVKTTTLTAINNHPHHPTQPWPFPLTGPLAIAITFWMPRPKAHYRTGKHAHQLRDNAPTHSDKRPDIDKLTRSTLDALTTAGLYVDDAQVAMKIVEKKYADHDHTPGARIAVAPLTPAPVADDDTLQLEVG